MLIAAVSLAVGVHYFYRAFPEASIDFRVTRDEAKEQAADFITARGFDLADYRHSAIFRYDNDTKTFLERELGLEGATQVIGDPVQLWRWSKPLGAGAGKGGVPSHGYDFWRTCKF